MYKTITERTGTFKAISKIDNNEYRADKDRIEGTTPVGILTSALSTCICMCVEGYFFKKGNRNVSVRIESEYENFVFNIKTYVNEKVDEIIEEEILAYVEKMCTVSKMISKEVSINNKVIGI